MENKQDMAKKGFFLAEETLKMVLALIGLGILIYFLSSLYSANKDSKNLEFAKSSLDYLADQINIKNQKIDIYNPTGWLITSWPRKIDVSFLFFGYFYPKTEERMPRYCLNLNWANCICICNDKKASDLDKDCDNAGYCLENSEGFIVSGEEGIEIIDPFVELNIDYDKKIISK